MKTKEITCKKCGKKFSLKAFCECGSNEYWQEVFHPDPPPPEKPQQLRLTDHKNYTDEERKKLLANWEPTPENRKKLHEAFGLSPLVEKFKTLDSDGRTDLGATLRAIVAEIDKISRSRGDIRLMFSQMRSCIPITRRDGDINHERELCDAVLELGKDIDALEVRLKELNEARNYLCENATQVGLDHGEAQSIIAQKPRKIDHNQALAEYAKEREKTSGGKSFSHHFCCEQVAKKLKCSRRQISNIVKSVK
jgi:hypothetical protein